CTASMPTATPEFRAPAIPGPEWPHAAPARTTPTPGRRDSFATRFHAPRKSAPPVLPADEVYRARTSPRTAAGGLDRETAAAARLTPRSGSPDARGRPARSCAPLQETSQSLDFRKDWRAGLRDW